MSIREIDSIEQVKQLLKSNQKYILLYFYTDWCKQCPGLFKQIVTKLNEKYQNITVYKVNITHDNEIIEMYKITKIPTVILLNTSSDISNKVESKRMSPDISAVEKMMKIVSNSMTLGLVVPNIGTPIKIDATTSDSYGDISNKFFVVILDKEGKKWEFNNKNDFIEFVRKNHEHFRYLERGACDISPDDNSKINKEDFENFIDVVNKKINTVIGLL